MPYGISGGCLRRRRVFGEPGKPGKRQTGAQTDHILLYGQGGTPEVPGGDAWHAGALAEETCGKQDILRAVSWAETALLCKSTKKENVICDSL